MMSYRIVWKREKERGIEEEEESERIRLWGKGTRCHVGFSVGNIYEMRREEWPKPSCSNMAATCSHSPAVSQEQPAVLNDQQGLGSAHVSLMLCLKPDRDIASIQLEICRGHPDIPCMWAAIKHEPDLKKLEAKVLTEKEQNENEKV
ncbi:hypothetical protein Baya_1529 [Bagarius yarrelli]|uniref:Uncharacterized protein n=1 Tax=Bagarius yarrelli TaxID=175774 RepID=A0A556TLC8_BAGYA|nr:hypothetical protein Baya_1529 [Bagarius yarrelli]